MNIYNPSYQGKKESFDFTSGTTSALGWQTLCESLEKTFNRSEKEKIKCIKIDENGIKAFFVRIP